MRIGVDLRFLWNTKHRDFYVTLIKNTILTDINNAYYLYLNEDISDFSQLPNVTKVAIQTGSIQEQTSYAKFLESENNDLCIFFDNYKPLWYRWEYYVFISSLKDVYYSNFSNIFSKHWYTFTLDKALKGALKIICFEDTTKTELIERFNLQERKIFIVPGFFSKTLWEDKNPISLDIKSKYTLSEKYIIYPGGNSIEKNYEKLVYAIEKLYKQNSSVDLVLLWDDIAKDILLRELVLKKKLEKNIHFLWVPSNAEINLLYKNSSWIIFPSFYEPFPFCLQKAVENNTPIIASNIKSIKNIFHENIAYFSPLSINSIFSSLEEFLMKKHTPCYNEINEKYSSTSSVKTLIEIIN